MMDLARRTLLSGVVLSTITLTPIAARAQSGTGGATGSALTASDVYLSVQKTKGVPLNDLLREKFLNRANCQCKVPVWLSAVVMASGAARAAIVNQSATVSMYLGKDCSSPTTQACCPHLASTNFADFRAFGLRAETKVDQVAKIWSTTSGNCAGTITGDATGSGGTGGTTDAGGASGAGGTGAGGVTGTGGGPALPVADCGGTLFGQTLWLFVGTSGDGSSDILSTTFGFNVDPEPPPAPVVAAPIGAANEALLINWTGLTSTNVSDLLGYQILCTRGDMTQVFKEGTYPASFESCPGADAGLWPVSDLPRTSFACSELLSASSTSYRLKILENDITYFVGVAAIDKKGNASPISPMSGMPVLTRDFYYDYRHGDPQGSATGGFCGISGVAPGASTAGTLVGLAALALALRRRRAVQKRADQKGPGQNRPDETGPDQGRPAAKGRR